ncbi:tyrosine-protein kinase Fer-like isoform X2 [Watersipora subatra]|uniref:tyrosine-protein kinase Fer-like isoform X2 n=1 Tax=Watersipora subatra TaxID=2589382 RepID=UPI00355BB9DB
MSFEKNMLGTSSQDMVFRLQDSEIKLLEMIKDCIQARVNSDKEYARQLSLSCTKAQRHTPLVRTPLSEVWTKLISKTETLSALVRKQTEQVLSSTLEKLQVLIADKRAAKQMFVEEKAHFDSELNKVKAEIQRNYGEYSKAMVKLKAKRAEYEDLLAKGKESRLDDLKRKYNVLTDKMHRIHNDYVLSVKEGSEFQTGLWSSILPMYMAAQEEYCQDSVFQCKAILNEYIDISDGCHKEASDIHASMRDVLASTDPKKEYVSFIEECQTDAPIERLQFDNRLLDGYNGILKLDEITVDDTTYEVLDQLRSNYKTQVTNKEPDISSYLEQVNSVKSELSTLSAPTTKSQAVPKRRHLKWLERKLKEAHLYKNRQQKIYDTITQRLQQSDRSNLPKASSLESGFNEQNGIPPLPQSRAVSAAGGSDTGFKSKLTKMFKPRPGGEGSYADTPPLRPGKRPSYRDEYCVMIPGESKPIKMTDNPESPLEDEEWFHGILPREEVQRLLKQDGDYLVRESKKRQTNESQYVLSVMWQGSKHFIIQKGDGGWRLEGNIYSTIQELIIQQHKSNTAVTNKSQAILKAPVMREIWQIKNDDISLEDKIGVGNFGEVYKGIYKGNVVAVKTCKEELQEDQKKKFIGEGRILRRYDHPNIVKFVGIAAQKNPVMIVMEFVSGGALLSWLRKHGMAEPKRNLVQMCLDAANGMAYLESKSVIHRDLAARNCLISESKIVKISDFGMSREEETYEVTQGMRQIPIKWTAPEALNYGKYTSLCDVWSYGILMWEIFSSGKTPYTGMRNQEARDKVDAGYRMSCPEGCPNAIYSLMRDCWDERPDRRPHFSRIVLDLQEALQNFR